MSTIFETMKSAFRKKESDAQTEYRNLRAAAADGKKPDNAFQTMERAGKSPDQFEADVQLLIQRRQWAADIRAGEAAEQTLLQPDEVFEAAKVALAEANAAFVRSKDDSARKAANRRFDDENQAWQMRLHQLKTTLFAASTARQSLIETAPTELHAEEAEINERIRELGIEQLEQTWNDKRMQLEANKSNDPGGFFAADEAIVEQWRRRYHAAAKERNQLNQRRDAIRAEMLIP